MIEETGTSLAMAMCIKDFLPKLFFTGRHSLTFREPHVLVTFEGATLWGPASEAGLRISVDAFEPYLDDA